MKENIHRGNIKTGEDVIKLLRTYTHRINIQYTEYI